MSDTRSEIAKIIERIRLDQSVLDKLKPPAFESLAAELVAQGNRILEVQRQFSTQFDVVGRYRDELNRISSFAIEAKQLSRLVDTSVVAQLAKEAATLNIDKTFLFTTSPIAEAAQRFAEQLNSVRLIDRTGILSMIEQYKVNQDAFASSLVANIKSLNLEHVLRVSDPTPEDVENLDLERTEISEANRSAILSVARLPLELIAKILRAPNEIRNLTPRQFEEFIADTLTQLGFTDVILTPRSRDGGKDIVASNRINGIPLAFYFECKKYAEDNKIQLETLRALLGTMAHDARSVNKGVLVTTSTFTRGSKDFILSETRLDGKDYDGILGWIDEIHKKI